VQLEGLYLKPYVQLIRKLHKKLIVYRAHNVEYTIWQGLASRPGNCLKKLYLRNLAERIHRYESDFMNRYDLLVPISEQDKASLNDMGNTKPACVIPVGIMPENFRQVISDISPKSLFFIGALDWMPNQEALCWFIDEVWLNLKQTYPLLSFHVAGRNAPSRITKKCFQNGIEFHGEVPDSLAFMDAYDIMVVPLFAGSGIRVKIIEAMARSKMVVTTSIGHKAFRFPIRFTSYWQRTPNFFDRLSRVC